MEVAQEAEAGDVGGAVGAGGERDSGGDVRIFTVRSNSEGLAVVPVRSGARYMLDSVVLRPTDKKSGNGDPYLWESLWANLTFKVPAR